MGSGRSKRYQFNERLLKRAAGATFNILQVAKRNPKFERVVKTSSIYATAPFKSLIFQDVSAEKVHTASNRIADDPDGAQAYAASKVKALDDSEWWMEDNNPSFDLVNIHPPWSAAIA